MSLTITTREIGDVKVIDASGRITLGEGSAAFRDMVRDLASQGHKKLLLNMSDVVWIDASGIAEMVSGFTTVSNCGGKLKLLGLNKQQKDRLKITKLYTVFEIFTNEDEAVRSF
jgi:anti-sigma B factor antagonist